MPDPEKQASSSSSSSNGFQSLPREDSPLLTPSQPLSSIPKSFANVFIAIVGAGVLGLPYTFMKTGWILGVLMLVLVAFLTYHCMMLLIKTRRKIESDQGITKINSFGDLGFSVYGPIGRFSVDALIVLSQAGFCVGYLIFIADTLVYLFNSPPTGGVTNTPQRIMGLKPKTLYIWSCLPFQMGLNSIPTLTHLAPLSIFADVVDIGAMGVVMVEDVVIALNENHVLKTFGNIPSVFYCIGVAVYAFEGVGMALPLESETKDKEKFGMVLFWSMLFISFMYAAFGVLGYFAFGSETKDIITTNFGTGLVSYVVQLGLVINLFFTFPLMMNPVFEVFERRYSDGQYCLWLRWVVVFGVSLVALMVPNFADFMSLVGSCICGVLGFVLPAMFHMKAFDDEMGWKEKSGDLFILFFGMVLAVSGTCSSLSQIFGVGV